MTIAEQALSLLDILPSIAKRRKLESFGSLDPTISASFPGAETQAPSSPPNAVANPFSMASRMNRDDYDDHARAEALTEALRQLRARHHRTSSARVLRQP